MRLTNDTDNDDNADVKIGVPLKYVSNFQKTSKKPVGNY